MAGAMVVSRLHATMWARLPTLKSDRLSPPGITAGAA